MLLDILRLTNDESDDFISEAIKEIWMDQKQNVQKDEIYGRINKNGKNMKLARVIFRQQIVPDFMKIGNKKISIREELPAPMICKYCLKFGHTFKRCANNIERCLKCGSVDHLHEECNTLICFQCKESHQPLSKNPPHYLYLQEALVRSQCFGISVREAKEDMRTENLSIFQPTYSKKVSVYMSQHQSSSQPEIPNKNRFDVLQEIERVSRDVVSKENPKKDPR